MNPFEEAMYLLDHYGFNDKIPEQSLLQLRQLLDSYLTIDDVEQGIAVAARWRDQKKLMNPDYPWTAIRGIALNHAEIANYEPYKEFQQEHQ